MESYANNKYYLDNTFKPDDQVKWLKLIDFSLKFVDEIEFNILRKSIEFYDFQDTFRNEIVGQGRRKDKIYHHKEYIRLKITNDLVDYIKEKPYSSWHKNFLEDISFLKNGLEFFATISHENYVIVRLSETDRDDFNKQGFNFEIEWPYPYDK